MKDKVCIIAEAGVNHNGDVNIALKMCDAAKEAGADIIKFQTFRTDNNVMPDCQMPEYQRAALGESQSHWDMLKELELSDREFKMIKEYCDKIGIEFLSTPSEEKSLKLILSLGNKIIKVSSGEITNIPFLRKIGRLGKKVILSTGMSTLREVENAISMLVKVGMKRKDIAALHCNSEYPTPMQDANLRAMLTIKEACKVKVGYSDHTRGIEAAIAAAAMGAAIIEKHFTLDRNMQGPDHRASLEPKELKGMVLAIRNIEKALGSGIKEPTASELKNKPIARKSIVASQPIKKGQAYSHRNITAKRPEKGISVAEWDYIIGKMAPRDFRKDELIEI